MNNPSEGKKFSTEQLIATEKQDAQHQKQPLEYKERQGSSSRPRWQQELVTKHESLHAQGSPQTQDLMPQRIDSGKLKKRGRPPGRSKRIPVSFSSMLTTSAGMSVVGVQHWRTLSKEECLMRQEVVPQGLTLYDIVRAPRILKGDAQPMLSEKMRLSNTGLTEDLSCPICMGTYQHVAVVKDCLHRFCEECIERWLRTGHQDCPKCRNKIPSRRSLRADPIFQKIVQRLFPDVENFERMNDRAVAAINERMTGLSERFFYQDDASKNPSRSSRRCHRSARLSPSSQAINNALSDEHSPQPRVSANTVRIILVPDPQQSGLQKLESIRLSPLKMLTLHQIKTMIHVSSGLEASIQLELRKEKDLDPLPSAMKIGDVLEDSEEMEITLYVRRSIPNQQLNKTRFESIHSVTPRTESVPESAEAAVAVESVNSRAATTTPKTVERRHGAPGNLDKERGSPKRVRLSLERNEDLSSNRRGRSLESSLSKHESTHA